MTFFLDKNYKIKNILLFKNYISQRNNISPDDINDKNLQNIIKMACHLISQTVGTQEFIKYYEYVIEYINQVRVEEKSLIEFITWII